MLSLSFMFSVTLFLLGTAAPTTATLACGDTIGPNEVAFLTHDLSCTGISPALTLMGGSILNLGGYTVNCENTVNSVGVLMSESGSILQHGTVTQCKEGVVVTGGGGHIVGKVIAKNNQIRGFFINSDDNELSYTTAIGNMDRGYEVSGGNGNTLKENLAKENQFSGFFQTSGNDNTYIKNRAVAQTGDRGFALFGSGLTVNENYATKNTFGFELGGNDMTVLSNHAIDNSSVGFLFRPGTGYTVLGNTAKKNFNGGIILAPGAINSTLLGNVARRNTVIDLVDQNADCDNNQWVGNRFRTADPADCIN